MTTHILMPGAEAPESSDLLIGVLSGANEQCQWAVACDFVDAVKVPAGVKLLTTRQATVQAKIKGVTLNVGKLFEDLMKDFNPRATGDTPAVPWTAYSVTAAMILAASEGASEIVVDAAGMDLEVVDLENHPRAAGQNDDLAILERVMQAMNARGVTAAFRSRVNDQNDEVGTMNDEVKTDG